MKRLLKAFSLITLLSLLGCSHHEITGDLIITNTHIIDVDNLSTISKQTIAIQNGRIKFITPFSESDTYHAELVVDGTDKYVIPGLWVIHQTISAHCKLQPQVKKA